MLLEIDHGIGFTTRRAVTTAEVELMMRVVDLPGRLLLALPISREQRRPVNGDLLRTVPRARTVRPSTADAMPPRYPHMWGAAAGSGLLGLVTRHGRGEWRWLLRVGKINPKWCAHSPLYRPPRWAQHLSPLGVHIHFPLGSNPNGLQPLKCATL